MATLGIAWQKRYLCRSYITQAMLRSLQSLRGIFAIMIFLHHFPVNGHGLFAAGGDCGVDFFLMLSGFVMSAGYGDRAADGSLDCRSYMWRRITRLYPLHLLCLMIYLLLCGWRIGTGGYLRLVPNLMLLQSWIPVESVYFSGDAASWCLSDLMFFYAVFPFLAAFLHRHGELSISAAIAVTAAYFALIWHIPEQWVTPIIYILPLTRLIDFVWGMLLWRAFTAIKRSQRLRGLNMFWRSATEFAAVGVTATACIYFGEITPRLSLASYWWIPSAIMIMVFALHDGEGGILSRLLNREAAVTFGNVSFNFYMLHLLVIIGYKLLLSLTEMEEQPWLALPTLLAITTLLSFIVYYRVELPVSAWLRRKFTR